MIELNLNHQNAAPKKKWEVPVLTEASIQSLTLAGSHDVSEDDNCPMTPVSKSGS
jgi:hypothetical protein